MNPFWLPKNVKKTKLFINDKMVEKYYNNENKTKNMKKGAAFPDQKMKQNLNTGTKK